MSKIKSAYWNFIESEDFSYYNSENKYYEQVLPQKPIVFLNNNNDSVNKFREKLRQKIKHFKK